MKIVKGSVDYANELSDHLRPIERRELWASHARPAWSIIPNTIKNSAESYAVFNDDKQLMCMTGVVPFHTDILTGGQASPWLLSTHHMQPRPLLQWTKLFIEKWKTEYWLLFNYIHEPYKASIRWAKWSGFKVYDAEPYGPRNELFHRIEIRS